MTIIVFMILTTWGDVFVPFGCRIDDGGHVRTGVVTSFEINSHIHSIRKDIRNSNGIKRTEYKGDFENLQEEEYSGEECRVRSKGSGNGSIKCITEAALLAGLALGGVGVESVDAFPVSVLAATEKSVTAAEKVFEKTIREDMRAVKQSPGWELARQKRNVAIKKLEGSKVLVVKTDETTGTQTLTLPWLPGTQIPYKSLPNNAKLTNEMLAGAYGEVMKDCLLYGVDTMKTRRQSLKKTVGGIEVISDNEKDFLSQIKSLYSGFPIVLATSIFQGGAFFFIKNIVINFLNQYGSNIPSFVEATVPILFATMGYWVFRTPSEVVKTNIQTGQTANAKEAIEEIKEDSNGLNTLYSNYPTVLWLDIPFQIINFVLYGLLGDYMKAAGIQANIATRLFAGITCGCAGALITCPLDVAKTRIILRKKELLNQKKRRQSEILEIAAAPVMSFTNSTDIPAEMLDIDRRDDNELDPLDEDDDNTNVLLELPKIFEVEGAGALFLGVQQRLLYTGLANG